MILELSFMSIGREDVGVRNQEVGFRIKDKGSEFIDEAEEQ